MAIQIKQRSNDEITIRWLKGLKDYATRCDELLGDLTVEEQKVLNKLKIFSLLGYALSADFVITVIGNNRE